MMVYWLYWLSIAAAFASVVGCVYVLAAALLVDRFTRKASPPRPSTPSPGVTVLKPLHGVPAGLRGSLGSFCTQNYPGPIQIVFGVQDPKDDAIAIVERLRSEHPAMQADLVVDATLHGENRKVSNLVNMSRHVEHDLVVVSDDDMRVDPDYLARVVAPLEHRRIGAVTCLYHGVAASGPWARLAALGINAHFLPSVVVGTAFGMAHPCFGSTIALRRETLSEIGDFAGVADCLADDYAIGVALRARGYEIAVPAETVAHICGDMSARELWHHEVRWARTIRSIDPIGHVASIVIHPFPLALIAALAAAVAESFAPTIAVALAGAALACRVALLRQVEHVFGLPRQSYWLLPLRDVWSLTVFLSSCFGQNARWKGRRYRFAPGGNLVVAEGSIRP